MDQIRSEIESTLLSIDRIYSKILRLPSYEMVLSTRPPKFMGSLNEWEQAENILKETLQQTQKSWTINVGDGAFYGPKIDISVQDALGRKHQTATIQLDFQLPSRFSLEFVDHDGIKKKPVIIHRAILGSLERMMAILMEHTGGKWPFWISPRQAVIIPMNHDENILAYSKEIADELNLGLGGFYVDIDLRTDKTLSKRIRDSQLAQYNYILVVGNSEVSSKKMEVKSREGMMLGKFSVDELRDMFINKCRNYE